MSTASFRHAAAALLTVILSTFTVAALAAGPVHVVKTDLKPLIRAGLDSPVQFAVFVPHAVSTSSGGTWSTANGRATWRYAVAIPTAVSLSFHASKSALPASAQLLVRGTRTTASYRARNLHRGELWSRIQPGEALEFTLTVAAADRSQVAFNIVSLQAGYRSLGAGVQDHPYYLQLKQQQAAAMGNAACVTNYECEISSSNTPPGAATVALVIGNLVQCSGSLINDVPGDSTPYVLTARHCETGQPGGGNPGAASTVNVYWDATTPCGTALGSIYDPNLPTQAGAQTVIEQQDAWLIQLDGAPVVSDAQFAGFDASGGAVQGGYTIHHAEGYDKQFTGWFGQAAAVQASAVQGTTYVSDFWETVNQIGNIGPGASGSGLFDQNNHLVGSLSLGRVTTDPSGYEACPVVPPSAPNETNGVADFTALASIWNSTADTTSTTGGKTLKSVLDPGDTGTVVVASMPAEVITFSASPETLSAGAPVQLTWSAPGATQCTAGGGVYLDGWSGPLAVSGTQSLTETAPGIVTYTLSCTYAGGRNGAASVTVSWIGPYVLVTLTAPTSVVWITRPMVLDWTSNVGPCSLSGGGLSLSNLPAAGTVTTTQTAGGEVTYTVSCGPPIDLHSAGVYTGYVIPGLVLEPTGTDRILGQVFNLQWLTYADSCVASGGAPNDGWAGNAFSAANTAAPEFAPHVTTLGTYTYTLTCSSGSLSVQQSVTVTFENNPPYTTAALSSSSVTFSDSPSDYVDLTWNSNLSNCTVNTSIPYSLRDPLSIPYQAQGSVVLSPGGPGAYVISVTCGTVTSAPLTLTVQPPPPPAETISSDPATVLEGQSFTLSWSATNAGYCAASGGIPNSGWDTNGAYADPPNGQFTYSPGGAGQTGTFTFVITCLSIAPHSVPATSAQVTVTVSAPSSSGSASPTGSHGGGGGLGVLELTMLALLAALGPSVSVSRREDLAGQLYAL
jgi:hypothetical protein